MSEPAGTGGPLLLGNLNLDRLIQVPLLPGLGGWISGVERARRVGGCAGNTAAWLAAHQLECALISRQPLGPDWAFIEGELAGLPALHPLWLRGRAPTECLLLLTPEGERSMLLIEREESPASGTEPELNGPPEQALREASLSLIACGSESRRAAAHQAAGGWRAMPTRYLLSELEAGREWELLIDSEDEAARPSQPQLERVGCRLCVLTQGARGGEAWTPSRGWWSWPAAPLPAPILDTVGAGDAFLAGLISGLGGRPEWADLELALQQAARWGAYALTQAGGWPQWRAVRCTVCAQARPPGSSACTRCGAPGLRHKTDGEEEFWARQAELREHGY